MYRAAFDGYTVAKEQFLSPAKETSSTADVDARREEWYGDEALQRRILRLADRYSEMYLRICNRFHKGVVRAIGEDERAAFIDCGLVSIVPNGNVLTTVRTDVWNTVRKFVIKSPPARAVPRELSAELPNARAAALPSEARAEVGPGMHMIMSASQMAKLHGYQD